VRFRAAPLVLFALAACVPQTGPPPFLPPPIVTAGQAEPGSPTVLPNPAATLTPFQPLPPDPTPTASPEPGENAIPIWIHPSLDPVLPPVLARVESPGAAALRLDFGGPEIGTVYAERVYALAAPFPTVADGISASDLRAWWADDGPTLLVDSRTAGALTSLWGESGGSARVRPAGELLQAAWDGDDWAVLPFGALRPEWKVIAVDGQSPLSSAFDPDAYPLTVRFSLQGEAGLVQSITALFGPETTQPLVAPANRDPGKLTTVAMTGVTALVRATAHTMEQRGLVYPARDIGDWLRTADILHISNEVPFAEDCPFPNPVQQGVTFCSDPRYIELLEEIGTDVVELTGDHFHDWGAAAMLFTLDMYAERGWPVYGGGANFDTGKQAALLEHNGNRFAFIGCNGKGGGFAQAGASNPGSVHCDFEWLRAETARLTGEGYLVIATFQHHEYYSYAAPAPMWADFRGMAEAGAVVVSGSQAHHPHGFEFSAGALIHYGLGNLFFDQLGISPGTEQAFIDRHVFYDGRYLGVELLTIRFEDFARARPMTPAERENLLRLVFSASGW